MPPLPAKKGGEKKRGRRKDTCPTGFWGAYGCKKGLGVAWKRMRVKGGSNQSKVTGRGKKGHPLGASWLD